MTEKLRSLCRAAVMLVGALIVLAPMTTWSEERIVIGSFGGRFQDAQRKAYFEPFEKATGIGVTEASGISVANFCRNRSFRPPIPIDVPLFNCTCSTPSSGPPFQR